MKVVVITGTSSGIGKDLAQLLAENKYKVYGLSRKSIDIENVIHIKCDITNLKEVQNAVNFIKSKEEHIDFLINNAGMGIAGSIADSDYEDILYCFNVNVLGTIRVTKEFLPIIANKTGRIINIGSVAGDLTIPYQGYYSMSKSMIDKFSECLKMELKDRKIHVTTVLPGDTKTGFTENRKINIKDSDNLKISKSIKKMENDEQNGCSPRKVSKLILSVMKRKHPPVRITVGLKYKTFIFLQRLLPRKLVLAILSKLYG